MFTENILKAAKKVLDKKQINDVQGNMHYSIERNLLTITDSFILAEIWMPEKYIEKFKDLEISDITIDYYTTCWLLAMLDSWSHWEISTISLWNAMIQDFIEYELYDLKSDRNWIKVRFPILEAKKLPTYKEWRLFNSWEDSTKNIAITSYFEKFQDVVWILCNADIPIVKVADQTYIAEWSIEYMLVENLPVRVCVSRAKTSEEFEK